MMHWYSEAQMFWPDCESHTVHRWMMHRIDSIEKIMAHVVKKRRRLCIQAGGYIGTWPIALAKYFAEIHTFEPVPDLYGALAKNIEDAPRIRAYPQALGDRCGDSQIAYRPGGCSTLGIDAERIRRASHQQPLGPIIAASMVSVDSLDLDGVDLIYLDTERSELDALRGAALTLRRDRPIVVVEILTGQQQEYGNFMKALGYEQIGFTHRDVIFQCRN